MASSIVDEPPLTASEFPCPPGSKIAPALSERDSVVRSAGVVSVAVLLSRVSGVVREMVMAYAFGASGWHDAFLLGFRIPNLPRDLFGEGAFSSAFVPTFTRSLLNGPGGKEDAGELARQVISAILMIVGTLCLVGMLFAPQLVGLLAPGFAADPAKFHLAVRLTRIMMPFLVLIALSSQVSGMLNAQGSFGIPATASIFFNAGAICVGLMAGYVIGPRIHLLPIEGMAYGILAGGLLQLTWQLPQLRRMGFRFVPLWKCDHPGLRILGKLMVPALLTSLALQINLIVNTSYASRMMDPLRGANGPVSWLAYALRFVQFPMGLFAVAIASAMLPSVSRSAAKSDFNEFRNTLSRSLGIVFFFTLPSSVVLMILGKPLIGAIYQSGHFRLYDTNQTAQALAYYAAGLAAFAGARVMTPAYYALFDSRTPMYLTLFSIGVNAGLPILLVQMLHMNFSAMALTTSIAMTLEAICLFEGLRRKLGGLDGRYLFRSFSRVAVSTALMGITLMGIEKFFAPQEGTRVTFAAELAVMVPAAILLFAGAAKLMRAEEFPAAAAIFWKPIRRYVLAANDRIRI